jgi:hypothetical protein
MRSYAKTSLFRSSMRLVVLIAVEIGSLQALSRLGSVSFLRTPGLDLSAWRLWLATTPPQDAIVSALRLGATACAAWLLAATGLSIAARLTRIPGLVRATEWTTPRAVRRLIDRAVALSVVATLAGGSAALAGGGAPPAPVVVMVGGQTGVLLPAGARSGATPVASPLPLPPAPLPTTQAPAHAPGRRPDRHTVQPGDNLWSIAAGHLAGNGITVSNGRIAPYWQDLVQEARPGLRSRNPDLIFPGETVPLPPIT